ncbi:hypothetical protein BsWGS_22929 [Bradybaena similaris]
MDQMQPSHRHQDEVVVVDSDSDEECSISRIVPGVTGSGKENMETFQNTPDFQFLDRAIALFPLNGRCGYWHFVNRYKAKYGLLNDVDSKLKTASDFIKLGGDILYLTQKGFEYGNASARSESSQQFGQNVTQAASSAASTHLSWGSGVVLSGAMGVSNTSLPPVSGFIPFSGGSAATAPPPSYPTPQSSHNRYGLNPPTAAVVPVIPAILQQLNPLVIPRQVPIQQPGAHGLLPNPLSALASPALANPQMAPATSLMGLDGTALHTSVPVPPMSEWPRPSPRTGPPPGTKITDEVKEIVVKRVSLPRGARLTIDQVNYQVLECIDVLSEAKEHVSMERLESMLLEKYQVRSFQQLNVGRNFDMNLQAAKDHNMKLGKVNAYVQNFVRTRSLCTLFELKECCREFHPEKKDFEHLKLGPLQKMPIIQDLFKFPMDEYIPEITSIDLIEHLHDYLDKSNKWTKSVNMDEFLSYLVETYNITSPLSLGIRMRSMPLAIQMLKKSKRDAASNRKRSIQELQEFLNSDIQEAFRKFRAHILQTSNDGSLELRRHYMNLAPEDAVREIITKFELLAHIMVADSPLHRKVDRMVKHFDQFTKNVLDLPIPRMLYHLSVCLSNVQVQETAQEFVELEVKQKEQQAAAQVVSAEPQQQKPPPTKVGLAEKIVQYINKCLEHGSLHLSHLGKIESKVVEDFDFSSFNEMGYGKFLEFLLSEPKIKAILEECGGTVLGSSSGSHEMESLFKPSQLELLEFICQSKHAGVAQNQQVETAMCEQFHVTDLRHLGHGNISRLCGAAEKPGKHVSKEYRVHFEAAICGKFCPTPRSSSRVGIQGSQTRETALACLTTCPLLEDMAEWSNWSLVFQPQLGPLRSFIEKHGGLQEIPLEGGRKTAISDFMALEVEPGKFLKICSQTTQEQFWAVLDTEDPIAAAGYLVSLIVANRGLESTPVALIANHVKTHLIALHARSSGVGTPGGPPAFDNQTVDLAVQFVTEMLMRLPVRIGVAVANQVLLEPLSSVVGSAKSKKEIMLACKLPSQRQRLELLGCLLGLPEWTSSMHLKYVFPSTHTTELIDDDLMDLTAVVAQEEEEVDSEDESDQEDSDIDSIFSDDKESTQLLPQGQMAEAEDHDQDDVVIQGDDVEKKISGEDEKASGDVEENADGGDDDDKCDKTARKDEGESAVDKKVAEDVKVEETLAAETSESPEESTEVFETAEETTQSAECDVAEIEPEKELTHEQICQAIVENIQKEEFGLGIQLDETGEKLMRKQHERQGRSLQRLSRDLYSKETHFVLELIQNADDNAYESEIVPSVKFVIDFSGVTVLNNELGFEEKNIRALCDVGKSTKEKHKYGYIGQKGIGFKSVFRVTGRPEVHSNGFHICFDVSSGPMGYILPHWIDEASKDEGWQTKIVLPWTEEIKQQINSHAARFNDIQPSLLLFLHRLKEITIENKVEGCVMTMQRKDLPDKEVQITHTYGTDRWLVLRKVLDASGVSIQMKSGVEVESTEIALAFPLQDKMASIHSHSRTKPSKLPVFAFLPLRSYGFRFIVQGDFDVPSSREDVDRDSSWNQWLRNEIHVLFVEALEAFKARPDLSPIKALIWYLQFVPLEGEVMDFFKPVATKILALLRAKECMPILTGDKAAVQWKMPSKTVIAKDSLVLEIISPESLQQFLGLYYLHPDVAAALDDPLIQALGIETVTTEHLLHVGQSIALNWDDHGSTEQVTDLAKWLACVYRSLDDFQENAQIFEKLCSFRIIPLSDGQLVCLSDVTVFLLNDGRSEAASQAKNKGNVRDPLLELKKDLSLVHTALTSTSDNEVNSQVVKLLLKMGIKQMTAHDLIHSHIIPILKSETWKDKKRDVLISYIVYIKTELDRNPSIIDKSELRSVARLATNHGIKSPSEDDVHFSSAFGNKIDLRKMLPGIEWTLVDSAYLPHAPSHHDVLSWHNFLSDLGVVDFLRVRESELHFDKTNIHETAWATYKDVWPDSPDGYVVNDFQCEEFHKLVTANQKLDQHYQQMVSLYELLDQEWDGKYKAFTITQLKSGSGHVLKDVIKSSFATYLETLAWVPSKWTSVTVQEDSKTASASVTQDLRMPAELYLQDSLIQDLLAHTVKYLNVSPQKNSSFTQYLKIKSSVSVDTMKENLIKWCRRDEALPDTPKVFSTTMRHLSKMYMYLDEKLSRKDAQDLFHNHPAIFVPLLSHSQIKEGEVLVGTMLKREEVWWSDPTDLFTKYRGSLELYKSPLAKRKFLQRWYPNLEEMFQRTARIDLEPNTPDLTQLLKHIATVHSVSDSDVLKDVLFLFSKIGSDLSKISDTVGGVKTPEAMKAERDQPIVVDLLTKAAVFPTKQGQWVSLSDNPMIADSPELEQMFQMKPGVHFLQLEVAQTGHSRDRHGRAPKNAVDEDALEYCMSLFESIKNLSDCVKTEEITSNFQQCRKGQKFMHDVVGLLQKFLYFIFPDVYEQFKNKKAATLKELLFSQVGQLEVRYELIGRPDVFEIRQEKCVVKDKIFYFHEQFIGNQTDINREVAKYFSEGNKDCVKELRNFLSQVVPILEGKSDESMDELLARQKKPIKNLPQQEEVWVVPPPIIEVVPEPEPEVVEQPEMVYGRALSVAGAERAVGDGGDEEAAGLKSWPPRSAVFKDLTEQTKRPDGTKPGMWPPPQGPSYAKTSKLLPSNIKFEQDENQVQEGGATSDGERRPGASHGVSRQSSQVDENKVARPGSGGDGRTTTRQISNSGDGRGTARQASDTSGTKDESKTSKTGDTHVHRQMSAGGVARGGPRHADGESKHNENREDHGGTARSTDGDAEKNPSLEGGSSGKRKLADGSTEDDTVVIKRRNSKEAVEFQQKPLNDGVADAQAVTKDKAHPGMTPAGQENMEGAMEPVISSRYVHGMTSLLVSARPVAISTVCFLCFPFSLRFNTPVRIATM